MILRVILAAAFGAVGGSFAAAVADRLPRSESIVREPSRCRGCARRLVARDLVPIVSWAVQRGRCRTCGTSIGSTTLLVECLTAVLFAACAAHLEDPIAMIAHWVLCTGLMSLVVIDVATLRLPRRITHWTAVVGCPMLVVASILGDQPGRIRTAFLGAVCALCAMGMLFVLSSGRLGDGDVRLSPLLGAYLGWRDLSAVFSGFFLAFLLGAVVGSGLVVVRRLRPSSALPFGPFLAAGALLTMLFDIDILR